MNFKNLLVLLSIFFIFSGCQTINNKSDAIAEKENKRYGHYIKPIGDNDTYYKNLEDLDKFEKRLNEIDFNSLSKKEKVTHGMLEYAFASNKDSLRDKSWEFGAGVSGFTGYLIDYNQQMFIPDLESGDLLLTRLELYNQFFIQVSLVQKIGLDENKINYVSRVIYSTYKKAQYMASNGASTEKVVSLDKEADEILLKVLSQAELKKFNSIKHKLK